MRRRSFLKNSTALGTSLLIGNSGLMITDQYERSSPGGPVQKLKELENEYIRFALYSDAIICNFGNQPYKEKGIIIKPGSYHLLT